MPKARVYRKITRNVKFASTMTAQLDQLDDEMKGDVLVKSIYVAAYMLYSRLLHNIAIKTGKLKASAYHWYDRKRSTDYTKTYAIGVNTKEAPHWHLVEFGHKRINVVFKKGGEWVGIKRRLPSPKWVPGTGYLRNTYTNNREEAISAAREHLKKLIKERLKAMKVKVKVSA